MRGQLILTHSFQFDTLSVSIFSLESPLYCSCPLRGVLPAIRQKSSTPAEDTDAVLWIVRQDVLMSSASGALSTEAWPCQWCETLCASLYRVCAHMSFQILLSWFQLFRDGALAWIYWSDSKYWPLLQQSQPQKKESDEAEWSLPYRWSMLWNL